MYSEEEGEEMDGNNMPRVRIGNQRIGDPMGALLMAGLAIGTAIAGYVTYKVKTRFSDKNKLQESKVQIQEQQKKIQSFQTPTQAPTTNETENLTQFQQLIDSQVSQKKIVRVSQLKTCGHSFESSGIVELVTTRGICPICETPSNLEDIIEITNLHRRMNRSNQHPDK